MFVMGRAHLEFRISVSQLVISGLPLPLKGPSNLDPSLPLLSGRLDLPPTVMDSMSYGSLLSLSLRRPFESLLSAEGSSHLEFSPPLRSLSRLGSTMSCLAAASGRVGAMELRLGDVCSVRGMAGLEVSFPAPDPVRLDVSSPLRGSKHVAFCVSVLETSELGAPLLSRSMRLGFSVLSLGLSRAAPALSAAAELHFGPSSPLKALA